MKQAPEQVYSWVSIDMLHACALTRLMHFRQHSTPLHGYIYTRRISTCSRRSFTLVHAVPLPKRLACGSLAISDAIFYSYANSMITRTRQNIRILALVREMPARCKKPDWRRWRIHKALIESCKTREMRRREACQATPCRWRRTNENYP